MYIATEQQQISMLVNLTKYYENQSKPQDLFLLRQFIRVYQSKN